MAQLKDTDIEGDLTITGTLTNQGANPLTRIQNDMTKFENMFCEAYVLDCTPEPGTNYTINSTYTNAYLIGNRLRLQAYCTRSSATDVGNISNERIVTFTINHGGKIKSCYNASALTYYTGSIASYASTIVEYVSDTVVQIGVNVTATDAAITATRTMLTLSCDINPNYY